MGEHVVEFDQYAQSYRIEHARSTCVSEENLSYFAEYKIEYLNDIWRSLRRQPNEILDFGSGIGNALPFMRVAFPDSEILALDISRTSLDLVDLQNIPKVITKSYDGITIPLPDSSIDCVFTACVFHHIPAEHHIATLREIRRVLAKNGMFVLFEHNPANPLTRRAVLRCKFDRDAVLISASEMRHRMLLAGFTSVRTNHCLFAPPSLAKLRRLERLLNWVPLGAQYHLIGR